MTVAEIKEYIDRAIDTAFAQNIAIDTAGILKKALIDTKGMLDELEKEKNMYSELEDKIVRGESIPLIANEKFIEMLEKDTELKENNK